MEVGKPRFQKYIFVCEKSREEGACCMPAGRAIRETLKTTVKALGLAESIRVSHTGCLDLCADGPNVLLMPDNKWFSGVRESDLDEIMRVACLPAGRREEEV